MGVRKGGFINNHPPAWLRVLWLLLGPFAFFHVLSWVMYRLSTGSIRLWLVGKGFQICRINCLPPPLYLCGTLVGSLTLQARVSPTLSALFSSSFLYFPSSCRSGILSLNEIKHTSLYTACLFFEWIYCQAVHEQFIVYDAFFFFVSWCRWFVCISLVA